MFHCAAKRRTGTAQGGVRNESNLGNPGPHRHRPNGEDGGPGVHPFATLRRPRAPRWGAEYLVSYFPGYAPWAFSVGPVGARQSQVVDGLSPSHPAIIPPASGIYTPRHQEFGFLKSVRGFEYVVVGSFICHFR